ncbi:MAG: ABC transporter ATP-binding protein, partial [Anaerolineaceae bacterium]|nr:ABC transporter ATP-binding protein [Anaerolineaceae bacterium]
VNELNVSYGAIHALKGISFELNEGEIVALIGANGAGKSTTLNTISGIMKPDSGSVVFEDEEISRIPPAHIVEKGIVQVPEGRKIFARMSVMENLEMGAYTIKDKDVIEAHRKEVFKIFPRLEERQRQMGGTLSGGEQQMLAIGRALMANPRLLLLDEPSMGLAPILVEQIFEIIQKINDEGVTILLVEQNAQMALSIADRGYVLETGTVALSGDADELMENPEVQAAYLGG